MRVDADDFARPCSCGREHQIAVKEILIEAGAVEKLEEEDRKSTRLNSSHIEESRMPSSA